MKEKIRRLISKCGLRSNNHDIVIALIVIIALIMFLFGILGRMISSRNTEISGDTPQLTDDFGEDNEELTIVNAPTGESAQKDEEYTGSESMAEAQKDSFLINDESLDTGMEIFFKDCVCEYDKDDICVYTYFVDDPAVETKGYAIYIQTPEETMVLFSEKDYLVDKNAGRLFTLWVETRGDIDIFGRIQGIDFANGMGNYKVMGIYNLEELIAEAYGLELLDYDKDFDCQQLEFTEIYDKDGRTVLRGVASALYNISGKKYSIEWEIDAETTHESAKAYLADFDIHPLYAAFLRNEISVQNPFVSEGDGYDTELSFFDDKEVYEDSFRKSFSLVDVNNDGDPELVFKMYNSPSEVVYILGVQDDKLICYDILITHTTHIAFFVYNNGIIEWGQNYDGEEGRYYTFTEDGKEHELIHFIREADSDSDLNYDYYYLDGNEEDRLNLQSDGEYESLVSSYEGEEPKWFDCDLFADILMR